MKAYKQKTRPEISSYEQDDINLPKNIAQELGNQGKLATDDFFKQLLGNAANDSQYNENAQSHNAKESPKNEKDPSSLGGIVFELRSQILGNLLPTSSEKMSKRDREPGINYHSEYYQSITRSGERHSQREVNEHSKQIQSIMQELKKLASSTKALQVEFGSLVVEPPPADPGKYYINFFEWMLIMIRQSRQKVEDSKAWMDTVQGKSKKMGYWGKAKKMGTTFTQANERNVATSTG